MQEMTLDGFSPVEEQPGLDVALAEVLAELRLEAGGQPAAATSEAHSLR